MDISVNSCKTKTNIYNGVNIKILTVCWDNLMSIGTYNSKNPVGYV